VIPRPPIPKKHMLPRPYDLFADIYVCIKVNLITMMIDAFLWSNTEWFSLATTRFLQKKKVKGVFFILVPKVRNLWWNCPKTSKHSISNSIPSLSTPDLSICNTNMITWLIFMKYFQENLQNKWNYKKFNFTCTTFINMIKYNLFYLCILSIKISIKTSIIISN